MTKLSWFIANAWLFYVLFLLVCSRRVFRRLWR